MCYRWPLDPMRDRQCDPWLPCAACGGEVYGQVGSLLDRVLCEDCTAMEGV